MLVPLLGYPSTRTVQSLLLLSWHEFGLNNDGNLWAFTGMALRMAQDLGLHLVSMNSISSSKQKALLIVKSGWRRILSTCTSMLGR